MAVAVHAVRRGTEELSLSREAAAAVCGLGTIGMMVLMLLIGAGYKRVFVIGNKDGQRIRAVTAGLCPECFCDIREADPVEWLRERTDGIDLYFESVGKNASISLGIDVAAPGGRIVAVGNPYTDMTFQRNTWCRILRNQLTVIGTWNSSFDGTDRDNWHRATECLRNGCVPLKTLITHRLPLEKAKEGFRIMRERKEDHGKVLLVGNDP
ncbi:MAG: zinc-binding dehydrogenase [Lachnospiraceae bacterium]|nr:zinc-binding dehydrogenase [Lachnospiraceae bacterium]